MARRGSSYWQDYPSTATPVTAGDYNNYEAAHDDVVGPTRTRRVLFRATYTGSGLTVSTTDVIAQAGWTINQDADNTGHAGSSTSGDYCYFQCPLASRLWDIVLHAAVTPPNASGYVAGHITKNGTSVSSSGFVGGSKPFTTSNETHLTVQRFSVPLALNDKLYWSFFASTSVTINPALFNHATEIVIRDAGSQ